MNVNILPPTVFATVPVFYVPIQFLKWSRSSQLCFRSLAGWETKGTAQNNYTRTGPTKLQNSWWCLPAPPPSPPPPAPLA